MTNQLNALGNERLIAAYKDAEAGRAAELLLTTKRRPPSLFSLISGVCRGILRTRGIDVKTLG